MAENEGRFVVRCAWAREDACLPVGERRCDAAGSCAHDECLVYTWATSRCLECGGPATVVRQQAVPA